MFPLSAAAGGAILKYAQKKSLFWKVLSATSSVIACISIFVDFSFTVWSIYTRRAPKSKESIQAYKRYLLSKRAETEMDFTEEGRHSEHKGEDLEINGYNGDL